MSVTDGGGERRGMQPEDLYRIRWVGDARLDPTGQRVAFVVTALSEADDDYRSSIFVAETADDVQAAGRGPRQMTRGGRRDASPRWSPDGRSLAFLSDREGEKPQLYVMPADGGEARKLSAFELGAAGPAWSPDSRYVCITVKEPLEGEPKREEGTRLAPPPRIITTLKYKLNGEGFTHDKRRHLHVVDVATGEARQLTFGDFDDDEPAWSPDGRRLAFVSARHEDRDHDKVSDLFVVDVEGGEPERLTDGSFTVSAPAWSPDGRTVAFIGHRDPSDPPRHSRLWLIPADGGDARCLTRDLDRNLTSGGAGGPGPSWSTDGRQIFVCAHERGTVPLLAVDVESAAVETVAGGERTVSSFSAAGETVTFTASDASHPAELFVRDQHGERRLTAMNDAWLREVSLSEAERFVVQRPDGFAIDAWLMRPAGYTPGTRHPLLVDIHGGPFAQYGATFLDEFQVQAGAGYGVLFGNPRGSSGDGEAFARSIIGEAGVRDSEDVLAVLDHALATFPDIDPGRLGVLGGSYGGYLTNWIVGHTDRFAAACSERGISNRLSKAGTDDIHTTWTYFRTEPFDDPELFLRLSPLMYVRAIVTPLLIMHSEEDLRCPMEQAEQLYSALKRLRRDVVFVRFPGENHDLSRSGKPSHRVARFRIQLEFFAARLRAGRRLPEPAATAGG